MNIAGLIIQVGGGERIESLFAQRAFKFEFSPDEDAFVAKDMTAD